jgi:hypothetical protein
MIEHGDEEMWIRIQGDKPDYKFVDPSILRNVPMMIPNEAAGPDEDSLIELTDMEPILDEEGNPVLDEFDMPMERQVTLTREAQYDFKLSMGNGLPSDKAFVYQTLIELAGLQIEGKPAIMWREMREYLRDQVGLPLEDDDVMEQEMQQQMSQGMPMPLGMPQGEPQQPPQQLMQALGGMG